MLFIAIGASWLWISGAIVTGQIDRNLLKYILWYLVSELALMPLYLSELSNSPVDWSSMVFLLAFAGSAAAFYVILFLLMKSFSHVDDTATLIKILGVHSIGFVIVNIIEFMYF